MLPPLHDGNLFCQSPGSPLWFLSICWLSRPTSTPVSHVGPVTSTSWEESECGRVQMHIGTWIHVCVSMCVHYVCQHYMGPSRHKWRFLRPQPLKAKIGNFHSPSNESTLYSQYHIQIFSQFCKSAHAQPMRNSFQSSVSAQLCPLATLIKLFSLASQYFTAGD